MHPKFKLTLAALAVSVVLTGCKSSQGPSVVAKNSDDRVIKLNAETEDKKEETPAEQPRPAPQKPQVTPPAPLLPTTPKLEEKPNKEMVETTPKPEEKPNEKMVEEGNNGEDEIKVITSITPVNTDSKGSTWRVVPLSQTGGVVNLSTARGDHTDYRLTDENSPLGSSQEFGKTEYNYPIGFELGKNEQNSPFIKTLNKRGDKYLGQHSGTYKDDKLVGNSQKINYLYVNQPYSSYGALFTDANNSNLFHVQLKTGRDSNGISAESEGSNANSAEYSVYTLQGKTGKWNNEVLGDAEYKGNLIARIEKQMDGKTVIEAPKVDGEVTLSLHLDNNWANNTLEGKVTSKTLGEIGLDKTKLAPAVKLPTNEISFYGTASATDHEGLKGEYSATFAGKTLNDAVGSIELENEDANNGDVSKYNAVFGVMKVEK